MARSADEATACPPPVSPGRFRYCAFRLLPAALLAAAATAHAAELAGTVVRVADGDTVTVTDLLEASYRVRLAGIDAPEKTQPFGNASREHLAALLEGRPVVVIWHKRDRYGRLVGEVHVSPREPCGEARCAEFTDAGLAQIESGLAWHYRKYRHEQTPAQRLRYALAEKSARAKHEGLWQDPHPVAPWQYRGNRRAATAARNGKRQGTEIPAGFLSGASLRSPPPSRSLASPGSAVRASRRPAAPSPSAPDR